MTDSPTSSYSRPSRRPTRNVPRPPAERRRRRSHTWLGWLTGESRQPRRADSTSSSPRRRTTGARPLSSQLPSQPSRRSTKASSPARQGWPPRNGGRAFSRLTLPKAPRPVLYGIRLLVIGVGVAAIAGTLLSVLTPADSSSDPMNTAQTASRTASAITAETGEPLGKTELRLTQEITPLQAKLADLQNLTPGLTASIYLVDLDTGKYVNLGGEQAIAAASTIKLPILLAFFQAVDAGQITVDQILTLQPTQVAGGSGNMQGQPPGAQYTALEVATQMIINSDNTATNMIIDLLGGPEVLNQHFLDWGLTATVLRNPLPDLSGTNTTSTQDLVQTIALVNQGELLSLRSRDRVMNILQRTYNKSLIPAGLGEGSVSYNKTGDIGSILGDAALVDLPNGKRYAIATLVQRPENDGRARELIRRISQTVYQEMHIAIVPALPPSNAEPATGTPTNPAPLNSDAAGAPPER